jgi:HD domain
MDTQWASDLARDLLAHPLPSRWAHTQGVAAQARALAPLLRDDAELVETACWLHDIGYSPALVRTGFHPLDGARYLRDADRGDRRVWTLVAHHTGALIEAEERGLFDVLIDEFPVTGDRAEELLRYLTYCDLHVGPTGESLTVDERIAEILSRYEPSDVVARSIRRAASHLREESSWVHEILRQSGTL